MIVQFRKGDAFRIAIELFILLLVSHFTQFTPRAGQAKRNKTLERGIRFSPKVEEAAVVSQYFGCMGYVRSPQFESEEFGFSAARHPSSTRAGAVSVAKKKFQIF